jgi:hypothetical protein
MLIFIYLLRSFNKICKGDDAIYIHTSRPIIEIRRNNMNKRQYY